MVHLAVCNACSHISWPWTVQIFAGEPLPPHFTLCLTFLTAIPIIEKVEPLLDAILQLHSCSCKRLIERAYSGNLGARQPRPGREPGFNKLLLRILRVYTDSDLTTLIVVPRGGRDWGILQGSLQEAT